MDALGLRQIWRVIVGVIGATLLLAGIAMIVLPGPAVVVIPLALAVLGTEFVWARRWLVRARRMLGLKKKGKAAANGNGAPPEAKVSSAPAPPETVPSSVAPIRPPARPLAGSS
jgi:hypothetical protein